MLRSEQRYVSSQVVDGPGPSGVRPSHVPLLFAVLNVERHEAVHRLRDLDAHLVVRVIPTALESLVSSVEHLRELLC